MVRSAYSPRKLLLAVTPGDPQGVGPEIVWKTIRSGDFQKKGVAILCIGARQPFFELGAKIIEAKQGSVHLEPPELSRPFVWLLAAPEKAPLTEKGPLHLGGYQSGWAIEKATSLALAGRIAALVTGPISKEHLNRGGYPYSGHTDFLKILCKAKSVTMMLANNQCKVSLVTTHTSLKTVPELLTRGLIRKAILNTISHLRHWWKISKPKVAVLALNPHAGEAGLFGREELSVIGPEIRSLKRKAAGRYLIEGPFPADTFFATQLAPEPKNRFDAVICMYHDQGLIPVKLLDFRHTVNVTLGLPIIRTSVDHGVAFDIAGKGRADPSSLFSAIELAARIARLK